MKRLLSLLLLVSALDPADPDKAALNKPSDDMHKAFSLHSWWLGSKDYPDKVIIWKATNFQVALTPVLSLFRRATGLEACSTYLCVLVPVTINKHNWTFTGVSANERELLLCNSSWEAKKILCSSVVYGYSPVNYSSQITIEPSPDFDHTYQYAGFDFLTPVQFSDILNSFNCHEICVSCFGPSSTACLEFIPIVDLHETLHIKPSEARAYEQSDNRFRGSRYLNIIDLVFTGWAKVSANDYSANALLDVRHSTCFTPSHYPTDNSCHSPSIHLGEEGKSITFYLDKAGATDARVFITFERKTVRHYAECV